MGIDKEKEEEEEEYPGEFKDNVIKILLLLPTIVFAGLYFFYDDNDLYLWLFIGLGLLELVLSQFVRKGKKSKKIELWLESLLSPWLKERKEMKSLKKIF